MDNLRLQVPHKHVDGELFNVWALAWILDKLVPCGVWVTTVMELCLEKKVLEDKDKL